jgi:3-phosphoshikimate 1-carboxyvinyltransferase
VVEQLTSHPYVDLTLDLLARFGAEVEATATGYRVQPRPLASPGAYRVEGDFSAAAYPAAAAALTGGRVTLTGLPRDSRQGDRGFLDLLAAMGARVTWQGADEVEVAGTGTLSALDVDLSSMPDQVPTLVALAPFARGTTRIRGVPHLRVKESDRLAAMAEGLRALGAAVEERPDGLVIPGVWAEERPPVPAAPIAVDPRGDHRIAMSLAVAGLGRGGVVITDPEVVGKSYPAFGDDLAGLLHRAEGLGAREYILLCCGIRTLHRWRAGSERATPCGTRPWCRRRTAR